MNAQYLQINYVCTIKFEILNTCHEYIDLIANNFENFFNNATSDLLSYFWNTSFNCNIEWNHNILEMHLKTIITVDLMKHHQFELNMYFA